MVPSDGTVLGQYLGAQLYLLCPSFSRAPSQLLGLARLYYTGYCPVPTKRSKLSLSQQIGRSWLSRLHLGSCFSRKSICSWSSGPVFQLLLCRLKLMGGRGNLRREYSAL